MSNKNRFRLVLLLIFIAAVSLLVIGFNIQQSSNDKKYFTQLNSDLDNISDNIIQDSDRKVKIEKSNKCWKMGQGPWDNGYLACYINQAYYVSVDNSADALKAAKELTTKLEKELKTVNFSGVVGEPIRGGNGTDLFLGSKDGHMKDNRSDCVFTLRYPATDYVPYYLPQHYESNREVQLYFYCGGESSTKVFEYVD